MAVTELLTTLSCKGEDKKRYMIKRNITENDFESFFKSKILKGKGE